MLIRSLFIASALALTLALAGCSSTQTADHPACRGTACACEKCGDDCPCKAGGACDAGCCAEGACPHAAAAASADGYCAHCAAKAK